MNKSFFRLFFDLGLSVLSMSCVGMGLWYGYHRAYLVAVYYLVLSLVVAPEKGGE